MKTLLTFFVLFFSSWVVAEDISDFQIEGMSIGDSLLDYMSENEINKNLTDLYNYIDEKKFITTGFFAKKTSNFDVIQVTLKINDNKYKVYGVGGNINPIDSSKCLIKQQEVDRDINNYFKNFEKFGPITAPHPVDKSGKSFVHQVSYILNSGGVVLIECYDFSNAVPYKDSFTLSLYSDELNQWLKKYQ